MTTTCDTNACDLPDCHDCPAVKPHTIGEQIADVLNPAWRICPSRACIDHASIDPADCELLQTLRDTLAECCEVIAGRRPDKDLDDLLNRANALTGCDIRRAR